VLGMFVATFVYCIAAALSIPPPDVESAAPQLTATLGVYLMLATFATLIVLVQHISTMLQAPNIAAAAGAELAEVVRAEINGNVTSEDEVQGELETRSTVKSPGSAGLSMEGEGYPVYARSTGYVQFIDPEIMLSLARERDLIIRLLCKPGHYVTTAAVLALVWPADRVDEGLARLMHRAFQIGNGRTPTQDLVYAVNQLTEMAVRAMSPAINDPFTAMTCLDHLGHGLTEFLRRGERSAHYYDRDGRLRLQLEPVTFGELLNAAFDMLRHASCDNASVLQHMLDVIDVIGQEAKSPEARRELLRHVDLIQAESQAGELIEHDRQLIQHSGAALHLKLQSSAHAAPAA
jgi:uncharacterized membrane protein